ncbi:MAG: hypothetical protein NZ550_01470 [Fimbriimonadales bacterium]|nr:hypothetical protein [Fimbriimonadales bacterium]MDW8052099.1 hypothetical protein [Armatimonadota bacterium]
MRGAFRYAPHAIAILAVVGLMGWFRAEQRRLEREPEGAFHLEEPDWTRHLTYIRAAVQQQPTEAAKLATLADLMTQPYRQQSMPLRFKAMRASDGRLVLRLTVAAAVPRWYTARAARLAHIEASRLLKREVPIHIYETYLAGRPHLIGICRTRNGILEVAFR